MNVWLDDMRPMPEDFNIHVKDANSAIALLSTGQVNLISLDHDLGLDKTGYDVAKYIEESAYFGLIPRLTCHIHSANPVGKRNMELALLNANKYWDKRDKLFQAVFGYESKIT